MAMEIDRFGILYTVLSREAVLSQRVRSFTVTLFSQLSFTGRIGYYVTTIL